MWDTNVLCELGERTNGRGGRAIIVKYFFKNN